MERSQFAPSTPADEMNGPRADVGYASAEYAQSLSEFGEPIYLRRSGGWLLKRRIAGSERSDAMGPYPLFVCADWAGLADDLRELQAHLVSVCLVADPFGEFDDKLLGATFDRSIRFK